MTTLSLLKEAKGKLKWKEFGLTFLYNESSKSSFATKMVRFNPPKIWKPVHCWKLVCPQIQILFKTNVSEILLLHLRHPTMPCDDVTLLSSAWPGCLHTWANLQGSLTGLNHPEMNDLPLHLKLQENTTKFYCKTPKMLNLSNFFCLYLCLRAAHILYDRCGIYWLN